MVSKEKFWPFSPPFRNLNKLQLKLSLSFFFSFVFKITDIDSLLGPHSNPAFTLNEKAFKVYSYYTKFYRVKKSKNHVSFMKTRLDKRINEILPRNNGKSQHYTAILQSQFTSQRCKNKFVVRKKMRGIRDFYSSKRIKTIVLN